MNIIGDDALIMTEADLPWERLTGKTVLISGANGYVPAYFAHAFMARNEIYGDKIKVIALCRNRERAKARFEKYLDRDDFVLHIQDVREPIRIQEPIHGFIHAASPASLRDRFTEPARTFLSNVQGCQNMLDLCISNPAELFLLISSVDVYGRMDPSIASRRMRESDMGILDVLNPRNCYSCGKRAAEALCSAYAAQYGVPAVIARPFQIIAPGIALDDGRLHADFISQMKNGNQIALKGDGSAKRTFLYATDAILGMLTVMLKGMPGEAYNVVDENGEATVLELARLMGSLITKKKVEVIFDHDKRGTPEVVNALSCVTGNSEKLRLLGWQAQVTLEEGVRRAMQHYGLC